MGKFGHFYRALERFEDAIHCHVKNRDNAERWMDVGGVAMDYFLSGKLPQAERSVLDAFQTLEKICSFRSVKKTNRSCRTLRRTKRRRTICYKLC